MPIKTILSSIFLSLIASTALAGNNGPIKTVTLSSGGLAEIVREAKVGDDSKISIEVPLNQVDDLLKSLVVKDKAGGVKSLTLNGPNPLEETFQNLPFRPNDLTSLPSLLNSIKGTKVKLDGKADTATILGVTTMKLANEEERPMLSLLWPDGSLSSVPVIGSKISIADPDMQAKIQTALGVIGNGSTDSTRKVDIGLSGKGSRAVDLSYVVAAPIWKTSYRLVKETDGQARLQAWAVFENASGEDWNNISVTLSSGKPVTLKQQLHQRHWKDRAEVEVDTSSVRLQEPGGGRAKAEADGVFAAAPMAMMARSNVAVMEEKAYDMASIAQEAETSEGDVTSTFALPNKLSVKNGETVSVPLIEEGVKAEMVSQYILERGGEHPVAAALLENDSKISLPQGILTVYDNQVGYVGDAKINNFPKGETQAVSFAIDQKVTVSTEVEPTSRVTKIKVLNGMVSMAHSNETKTVYTIKGAADAERVVLVEQAHQPGSVFKSEHAIEAANQRDRMKITVPAGVTKKVEAVTSSDYEETVALAHIDPSMIEMFVGNSVDPDTRSKLKALADARSQQMEAQRALDEIEQSYNETVEAQKNTRENLQSVPPGDMQQRYLNQLSESEDTLEDLRAKRKTAQETIRKFEGSVREAIQRF
ncbi:DUF4139 domain-containing protein [Rhizobium sp. MHM7A]|uniref:DUF4139 domain-containing protein n=1 Tax=Rhizobium sp. MHM7A TaxID=2583233 RepID=UPI001105AF48|nr:DUF4139 domain-containing protein [Rhizobium sp. MHM7A]TLX17081.1 DUF4139 domain-containing protein [Rhizobium sp. MHM7A]